MKSKNQENCINLWSHLTDNPCLSKEEAVDILDLPVVLNNCYACEVALDRILFHGVTDGNMRNICPFCPVRGNWSNLDGSGSVMYCHSAGSAYEARFLLTGRLNRLIELSRLNSLILDCVTEGWVEE